MAPENHEYVVNKEEEKEESEEDYLDEPEAL